ncbi:uncharacterized protein LOC144886009 [Branchiostoma floridae x Branchiostoma japonicum]
MSYGPISLPPGVKPTLVVFIAAGIVLANAFVVQTIVKANRTPTLRGFARFLAILLVCGNTMSVWFAVSLAFSVTDQWQYRDTFCRQTILDSFACYVATLAMMYVATHPTSFQHNMELNPFLAFVAAAGILPFFHITGLALVLICD